MLPVAAQLALLERHGLPTLLTLSEAPDEFPELRAVEGWPLVDRRFVVDGVEPDTGGGAPFTLLFNIRLAITPVGHVLWHVRRTFVDPAAGPLSVKRSGGRCASLEAFRTWALADLPPLFLSARASAESNARALQEVVDAAIAAHPVAERD
jgi:hypothetical protein